MKLRFSHLKIGRLIQKERIVSQPAFFRGKLAVSFRECSLSPFLLGGGENLPGASSLPPRSWVGSMWLLAITSLETMPWVTGFCVGFMGSFVFLIQNMTKVVEKQQFDAITYRFTAIHEQIER